MPQLDLVGVGASSHGESRRETPPAARRAGDVSSSARADDADAPAESVLIRVRDGIALADLLGAALRRDGSTKGSSNPKAAAEAATVRKQGQGAPRADSRRSTASKAAVVIAVLPTAAGKVVANKERRAGRVVARAWRRPAAGARVFASEAVGLEPVSPKVSCFGAVLPKTSAAAAPPGTREGEGDRGEGCWASVAASLRGLCSSCRSGDPREGEPGARVSDLKDTAPEPPTAAVLSPPMMVAAGLGDVKRLASRRTENMEAEGRVSV